MPNGSKYHCFTINNPTQQCFRCLQALADATRTETGDCRYLCYGFEIAPSTGTFHLQGYIELRKRCPSETVRKALGGRADVTFRYKDSTSKSCREYCSGEVAGKEKKVPGVDFFEYGCISEQRRGKRNDLMEIKQHIDDGKSDEWIARNYFVQWCIYRKSFETYRSLVAESRNWPTRVWVFFGKTGTGKTRAGMEITDGSNRFVSWCSNLQWFDGYSGQSLVILDEMLGSADGISPSFLLRLLDCYELRVPTKGSTVKFRATDIVITSNLHPRDWFPELSAMSQEALLRRFTRIWEFDGESDSTRIEAVSYIQQVRLEVPIPLFQINNP